MIGKSGKVLDIEPVLSLSITVAKGMIMCSNQDGICIP